MTGRLGRLKYWLLAIGDDKRLPPPWLRDVGPGDFEAVGREFVELLQRLGGLESESSLLDVGCGSGRLALPLTRYLSNEARYVGIDVVEASIRWCERHITPDFSNFTFHHADVRNARYNPAGRMAPTELRFPGDEASFDIVALVSVFTHMLPEAQAHYLREALRVLRPGGRLFATYFLWNDERPMPSPAIAFSHVREGHRLQDAKVPESALAIDETLVREQLEAADLSLVEPIHYGNWRDGGTDGRTFQDIVVASRDRRVTRHS